jgi:hypothetical protein
LQETEQILKGSSDDGLDSRQGPILATYDNVFKTDGSNLLFNLGGSIDLPSLHPPPVQIFVLWQAFLNNVHPLLRLLHAPTVQQQLLTTALDLSAASPAVHALLFAIYANAVVSMRDDAYMAAMNEESSTRGEAYIAAINDQRWTLVSRYTTACQYALQKAEFLRSSDLTVLQAFVLHLVSSRE